MKPFFKNTEKPMLFGHRGYSSIAPENTLSAFAMCVERGIPGVELDVHLCKTGELVVVHDSNLKRVSGQDVIVEELTFQELRKIDVGSHKGSAYEGEQIPLLSELFRTCSDKLYYDIELKASDIKNHGLEQKTWETICAFDLEKNCMISSFNPISLRRFNTLTHFALPTAVIYSDGEGVPRIFRHGWGRHIARCNYLKPDKAQVTNQTMEKFHTKKGYPICSWTVNSKEDAKTLLDMGVEGIISNNPGDFLDLVRTYTKH
ncbi:glycerophosphodiester phosphodiesterase family protein [uncultured Sphaerochaeta sp.]|uniref:glycerophosphodiester phosphodiesterase n=1 Tax=uncultured Sphaerochaeta sp. TaxID=886478 RepID=UPI002A0A705E|nr:glycerophosphodiester phosphodiesterase family protein [uncultured Sphaerochaeta sp.]